MGRAIDDLAATRGLQRTRYAKFVRSSNQMAAFDREVIVVIFFKSRPTAKMHKPIRDESLWETTWQLFRTFLHEWRMIQRTAACLLRDSPGVIRGQILRILLQLCKPRYGVGEATNQHCHLDLLWTYRESRWTVST